MNREDIVRMAREQGLPETDTEGVFIVNTDDLGRMLSAEREACEALHDHEDVQAPVGNSSWGEAYQEGWGQGTAAYRDAIKARGQA
jgi:hypothetical protein